MCIFQGLVLCDDNIFKWNFSISFNLEWNKIDNVMTSRIIVDVVKIRLQVPLAKLIPMQQSTWQIQYCYEGFFLSIYWLSHFYKWLLQCNTRKTQHYQSTFQVWKPSNNRTAGTKARKTKVDRLEKHLSIFLRFQLSSFYSKKKVYFLFW